MGNELFALCVLIIGTGMFGVLLRRNVLKTIISLGVVSTGVNMLMITRGYVSGCTAPILGDGRCMVDPIPQALTLTSIVIGASVMALALAIAVRIYEKRGTLEIGIAEE
jgi:multicomponent Na+:H+ antiporter subunit C